MGQRKTALITVTSVALGSFGCGGELLSAVLCVWWSAGVALIAVTSAGPVVVPHSATSGRFIGVFLPPDHAELSRRSDLVAPVTGHPWVRWRGASCGVPHVSIFATPRHT